jgi:hypothetical protein
LDTKPDVVINAVILVLGKQRQGDQEFKASLKYMVIGYVSKTTTTKKVQEEDREENLPQVVVHTCNPKYLRG